MDTKIIEYVIAIAEEKSLSKAAERLYLTQPALSQRLKALEDKLGTPLFIRDKGGMTITDAGRIYVNGGRSILQIKQEALGKLSGMDRNNKDRLRFGCATSQALECIPAFRQQYPDIELITQRCDTPTAKESLIMGRMDIAVLLTSSLQHSTLEYLPLSRAEVDLSRPPAAPGADGAGALPAGLRLAEGRLFYPQPAPLLFPGHGGAGASDHGDPAQGALRDPGQRIPALYAEPEPWQRLPAQLLDPR